MVLSSMAFYDITMGRILFVDNPYQQIHTAVSEITPFLSNRFLGNENFMGRGTERNHSLSWGG